MRSNVHISGHPLHPMLAGFPAAYLLGSAVVDVCATVARREDWQQTARHMTSLGLASALVAATPGLVDYLSVVPPESSAKRRATQHLLANVSALGLFALGRWRRSRRETRAPWLALGAEVCGAGLVAVAGWLGGTLVYRNQIGVDHRYADAGKSQTLTPVAIDRDTVVIDEPTAREIGSDQMRLVRSRDRRVVVARTSRGLTAFADRCPHKGGPLSDGTLACDTVQCPWHGSQFDVFTGDVKHGPAQAPIDVLRVDAIGAPHS